ncbi:MAG: hypothetical protein IJI92_02770 [Erysipelotrichaceae bacterium]|nr:hypothetical protein [Erysipelotrichaceae bacterium]
MKELDKEKGIKEEKMDEVSGGGCWFNARFVAPDGHDVGCEIQWYRVQFSDNEFCNKFPSICPIDGGPHDNKGRHYCGNGNYLMKCSKCGHFVDKQNNYTDGWGFPVDD